MPIDEYIPSRKPCERCYSMTNPTPAPRAIDGVIYLVGTLCRPCADSLARWWLQGSPRGVSQR